jgi:hypothetical protein
MRRHLSLAVAAPMLGVYLVLGLTGLTHYLDNYWRFRGFGPPRDPSFVKVRGSTERIIVKSAAIGGRAQVVYVYLPPGYLSHPQRRYPVFYLLHGFPGRPQGAFLWTNQVGVAEDVLVARHAVHPAILVMPYGATGFFQDTEWVNGVRPGEGWETFVTRDVVRAIDSRYRTIRDGRGRALGGLSAGAYAALNIGLHHPGEFGVLESWSGYVLAEHLKSVFGGDRRLIRFNSPLLTLPAASPALRQAGTYIWLYAGDKDRLKGDTTKFTTELRKRENPVPLPHLPGRPRLGALAGSDAARVGCGIDASRAWLASPELGGPPSSSCSAWASCLLLLAGSTCSGRTCLGSACRSRTRFPSTSCRVAPACRCSSSSRSGEPRRRYWASSPASRAPSA